MNSHNRHKFSHQPIKKHRYDLLFLQKETDTTAGQWLIN